MRLVDFDIEPVVQAVSSDVSSLLCLYRHEFTEISTCTIFFIEIVFVQLFDHVWQCTGL